MSSVLDNDMNISKSLVLSLTAAATLFGGGFAVHQASAADRSLAQEKGFRRGQFLQRAREKLGLTDEQTEKIKSELQAEKGTIAGLLSRLRDARTSLRSAIQAPDANEAAVREASAKVAAVEADIAVERMKLSARIQPILTPEQRAKVNEFWARMGDVVDQIINRMTEAPQSE
jgi:Spy/CpxP family protein refolding chaperone